MKIDREDGMRLQRIGCVLAFVAVAGMVTACSRSGSRRKNQAPSLGAPSGPGLLTGSDPSYTALVNVGDPLDLDITATDPDSSDVVTVTATVSGGTLTATQAGFGTSFPASVSGASPQTLGLAGTAAMSGEIVLLFEADDGSGRIDAVMLTIRINTAPSIGSPGGAGFFSGSYPDYTLLVVAVGPLNIIFIAGDPDPGDVLTFTADVTGGSLTAGQAGFAQTFPVVTMGPSPQTLVLTGTAANSGDIVLIFDVSDTAGAADLVTLTIDIRPPGPRVSGMARYTDVNMNAVADAGDQIVLPFTEDVIVNGATDTDLLLPIAGNLFGSGATVAAGPGSDEVTVTLGSSPDLKTRGPFNGARVFVNDSSAIDVSPLIAPDAIESLASGSDAVPSIPIDIIPFFVDSGQNLGSSYTSSIAVGDLDDDGDLDFVTTDLLGGGGLIWENDGAGMFSTSAPSMGVMSLGAVDLGDVNRDGHLDIVFGGLGSGGNDVWLNDGLGSFPSVNQSLGSGDTHSIKLADLNGDGALDLVAGNASAQGNTVWLNDGTGNFVTTGQSLGNGETWSIALGDLNGDGYTDIASGNDGQPDLVWFNDGTGNFPTSSAGIGNDQTRSIALGDMDSDGDLDIVSGSILNGPNRIWLNDGVGSFTDSGQTLGSTNTVSLALADLDADGDVDIVNGVGFSQGNRVWLNDGSAAFTDAGAGLGLASTIALAVADFDRDGDLDVLEGIDGANRVWMNSLSGTWGTSTMNTGPAFGPGSVYALVAADVDRDGNLDIVIGVSTGPNQVWLGDGTGMFMDSGQALGNSQTWGLEAGDMDGDGDLDLVAGNRGGQANQVWENDGTGVFTPGQAFGSSDTAFVTLGDVDGNGTLDVVAGSSVGQPDRVWLNDGSGNLTDSLQALGAYTTTSVALGDVDLDGDLDLITSHAASAPTPTLAWENLGAGVFQDTGQSLSGIIKYFATLADVNRDGSLDILAGGAGSNQVFFNDGTGVFMDSLQTLGGGVTFSIAVVDLDGDGTLDMFGGNITGAADQVWWNDGAGNFTDSGQVLGSSSTYTVAAGDFDHDGDIDLISGDASGGACQIWLNE